MALELHTVELRAKDSMSPVFKTAGANAARSAKEIATNFAQAGEQTRKFSSAHAAMGVALSSSTMLLGEWSRAAAQDAVNQERLQQSVENTGESYDKYADAIDKAIKKGQEKAFGDDATREALVRLNTVTNDASVSIDKMGLVMDFARAKGISLADSAGIIAKVYGGNVGILTRYGIALDENATSTEALAKIQQISAGQADVYANSNLGWIDKQKDKWGELTETIGGSTGELQQFLMLMPGLTAGYTAISGLVAGMGGLSALAKFGGPAALLALGGVEAYRTINGQGLAATGTSPELTAWNAFFGGASGVANWALPGNPFDSEKYSTAQDANSVEDVLKSLFFIDPVATGTGDKDYAKALYERLITFGVIPQSQYTDSQTGRDEQLDLIKSRAASSGLTLEQFIMSYLNAPGGTAVYDPVSQKYMDKGELQIYTGQRTQLRSDQIAAGANVYNGSPGTSGLAGAVPGLRTDPYGGMGIYNPFYQIPPNAAITADNPYYSGPGPAYAAGGSGAVANSLSGQGNAPIVLSDDNQAKAMAANIQAQTDALVAQYPAWENVIRGIDNANDAQSAFTAAQSGLNAEMNIYQGQASEYTGQLNAQDAAYEILQKRQEEGIALTGEQTKFMEQYAHATEVGTGAVEDSTVAAGIAAQNMLLNKDAMDTFKTSTGEVTDAIMLLIEALGGVPDDIRTQITLDGAAAMHAELDAAVQHLNSIDGQTATFHINTQQTGVSVGNPNGPSIDNNQYRLHGGFVAARHGRVLGNNYTLVGEDGPELLAGGRGAGGMVIPASATRAKMRGGSRGGAITINGPVNVYANDPMQFQQQLRSSSIMEYRQ